MGVNLSPESKKNLMEELKDEFLTELRNQGYTVTEPPPRDRYEVRGSAKNAWVDVYDVMREVIVASFRTTPFEEYTNIPSARARAESLTMALNMHQNAKEQQG